MAAETQSVTLTPKTAWSVIVVMAMMGIGGGGSAVASLMQTSNAAEAQPEIQRSLDRMDKDVSSLKGQDERLSERLDEIEEKSKRRHERVTRDLDDLDSDLIDVSRILRDLCRSDKKCRRKQGL